MVTPLASFSGLATGIDTAQLISQLVRLERRPIVELQRKKSDIKSIVSRLSSIKTKVETLKAKAEALDTRDEFLRSKATSSDETKFTVTAAGGATLGKFDITITNIATAERRYGTSTFSAKNDAALITEGTLTINTKSVVVDATDTLETVVSKINGAGASVTAGLLFDGTNYRLQVSGNNTGSANALVITDSGTNLGIQPGNVIQTAANASFNIDTFPMTSASNTVTEAIPGVTLELLAATATTGTITVSRDPDETKTKIRAFIDAYNDVMKAINGEFVAPVDPDQPRLGDSLSGDATLRHIQSALRSTIANSITGLSSPYNVLVNVGVKSDSKGILSLDDTAFDAAFGADPEKVSKIFIDDTVGATIGVMELIADKAEDYARSGTGALSAKILGLNNQSDDMDERIDVLEAQVDKFEERTRAEFAALETLVSNLQAQGAQMLSVLAGIQTR